MCEQHELERPCIEAWSHAQGKSQKVTFLKNGTGEDLKSSAGVQLNRTSSPVPDPRVFG